MTFTIDTDLIENNDVRLTTDGNGDLALEHVPTGTTLTVDQDASLADLQAKTSGLSDDGSSVDVDKTLTDVLDGAFVGETPPGEGLWVDTSGESPTMVTNVEGFERSTLDHYNGDTGAYSISSDRAFEGTRSLSLSTGWSRIASTSGLGTYPSIGDTFSIRQYSENPGGGERPNSDIICFGASDVDNHYRVEVSTSNGLLRLRRRDATNGDADLDSAPMPLVTGQWIKAVVDWGDDDHIVATLYDDQGVQIAEVSATDGTFSGNTGIAFNGDPGTEPIYWDGLRIEE